MNRWTITGGLAAALTLPLLLAPMTASASCSDRKAVGTVVGGVGGALIGNSIARGGGGAVLGGLGGAVLGHEVARSTCGRERYREDRRAGYRRDYRARRGGYGPEAEADRSDQGASYGGPPPEHALYYDNRARLIDPAAGEPATARSANLADAATSACRTDQQTWFNDRGEPVQTPVQTCGR